MHGEGKLQEDLEQMQENCDELAAGIWVETPPPPRRQPLPLSEPGSMVLLDWAPHKKDVVPGEPGRDPGQDGFPRSTVRWEPVGKWLTEGSLSGEGAGGMQGRDERSPQGVASA